MKNEISEMIMGHYERLVHFLGTVLGENCEIGLLDLREGKNCITAIEHGYVSGREIGAPITDFVREVISSESWRENDYIENHSGIVEGKKKIRSSSYFIKYEEELLGMLYINVDDSVYEEISKKVLALGKVPEAYREETKDLQNNTENMANTENFSEDIETTIEIFLAEYVKFHRVPLSRLTQGERVSLVEEMQKKGLFLMNEAIAIVADKMMCSETTICRYLENLQRERKKFEE